MPSGTYARGTLTSLAGVAQSVERKALNLVVVGSSPTLGAIHVLFCLRNSLPALALQALPCFVLLLPSMHPPASSWPPGSPCAGAHAVPTPHQHSLSPVAELCLRDAGPASRQLWMQAPAPQTSHSLALPSQPALSRAVASPPSPCLPGSQTAARQDTGAPWPRSVAMLGLLAGEGASSARPHSLTVRSLAPVAAMVTPGPLSSSKQVTDSEWPRSVRVGVSRVSGGCGRSECPAQAAAPTAAPSGRRSQ